MTRFSGLPAVLYGRVSGKVQETDGYSLPNQLRESREAAGMLGVRIVAEDFEQGSGKRWDLAGITAHLRRVKSGQVKALILKNVSRLARTSGKQAWIEHLLAEAGALIWSYDETYEDNAAGRLKRRIMVDVAEFQLEQAREDSMKARYEKVEQFKRPVGNGPPPYGWRAVIDTSGIHPRTVGYEHDPAQVKVIERFRALRTMSGPALCALLNAERVPTPGTYRPSEKRPRSGLWLPSTVRQILINPMTWGEYRYGPGWRVKSAGRWREIDGPQGSVRLLQLPPILERGEVEEILSALASRRFAQPTGPKRQHADDPFTLRGRLVCGHCGGRLKTKPGRAGGRYRSYICARASEQEAARSGRQRCWLPPVVASRRNKDGSAPGVEDVVWEAVIGALLDDDYRRAAFERARETDVSAQEHADRLAFVRATIRAKLTALDAATERWREAVERGDELDRDSFERTRIAVKREIETAKREERELTAYRPTGPSAEDEEAAAAFAALAREGLAAATRPPDRARLIGQLSLVGRVTASPSGGYRIGGHRYRIEWSGWIDPSEFVSGSGDSFGKLNQGHAVEEDPDAADEVDE
jgi:DNA invertase Pin-like site-specific DNA recombinase